MAAGAAGPVVLSPQASARGSFLPAKARLPAPRPRRVTDGASAWLCFSRLGILSRLSPHSEVCCMLSLSHSELVDLNSPLLTLKCISEMVLKISLFSAEPVCACVPRRAGLSHLSVWWLGKLPAHVPEIRIRPFGSAAQAESPLTSAPGNMFWLHCKLKVVTVRRE